MQKEILFLDIGDILTIKDRTREGNDFDEYKIQLLERILNQTNFNIIWISSWVRNDSVNIINQYLEERGFKSFHRIIGPICDQSFHELDKFQFDDLKPELIKNYVETFKPYRYLIIDSDIMKDFSTSANFLGIDGNGIEPLHTIQIIKNYKKGLYNVSY